MRNLTDKQQAFIYHYLMCWNATEAARRAGYQGDANTLGVIGYENVRKPKVAAAIRAHMDEYAMTAHEVLYHLAAIARGTIEDVVDDYGNLDMAKAKERGKANLIKRVKQRTYTSEDNDIHEAEIEAYDRLRALEILAKHHHLTNTVRIDDWRSQAVADIRAGNLDYLTLAEAFDDTLAAELFAAAGIPIQISED